MQCNTITPGAITETNQLMYSTVAVILEMFDYKVYAPGKKQSPFMAKDTVRTVWERTLEAKIRAT